MASIQVIEGIWEELTAQHPELKGKRVRVMVLPEETTPTRTLGDLYGILKGHAHSTEQEIRDAQLEWNWTQPETHDEK